MLLAIAAVACQNEPEIVPEVNVTSTSTTLPVAGTEDLSFKVTFKTNVDWTAALKEQVQWCTVTPAKGVAGDAAVTVIAEENEAEEERTATLVITAGAVVKEILLTQEAVFIPRLAVEPAGVTIAQEGGSATVEVKTNVEYTVTVAEDATWLTYTKEGNVITFTAAAANEKYEALVAGVTFATEHEGVGATINVYQDGRAVKLWAKKTAELEGFDANKRVKLAKWGEKLLVSNATQVYVLNPMTGAVESTIPMPEGMIADNVLVDDAGHLLIGTDMPTSSAVTLYYVADPTNPAPELIFTYPGSYYAAGSGNIRVKGNVKDDALITAVATDGAGGAVLYWEVTDGVCATEYSWINPPYTAWSVGTLCAAPVGTSLADGIFYIGYAGDYSLRYATDIVAGGGNEWAVSYATGSSWKENYNCISTAEWAGHKYAAILAGCHFDYDDPEALLLNVDNPAAASLVYTYSATYDVTRDENWANMDWVGDPAADGRQTPFPNSDVLIFPTEDAIVMAYVDAAYGALACVAVK